MNKLNQSVLTFAAGLCVALLMVFTLGASSKQEEPKDKMSIEVVPVLGGVGGILMTVTNHTENKAYMYVMNPDDVKDAVKNDDEGEGKDKGEDEDDGGIEPMPELIGTIDLSSAGNERLTAEIQKD